MIAPLAAPPNINLRTEAPAVTEAPRVVAIVTTGAVLAAAILNDHAGQGQSVPTESFSSGRGEAAIFDAFTLPLLGSQPDQFDLPTERDILAGMNVGDSLRSGARPRANLVPQPQDTVVAIGALLPGDTDDPTARKRQSGAQVDPGKVDVKPYLMNPVANTALGPPPSLPENEGPLLVVPLGQTDAVEPGLWIWRSDTDRLAPLGDRLGGTSQVLWWEEALVLTVSMAIVMASLSPGVANTRSRERLSVS
jgi:hypothetical protein